MNAYSYSLFNSSRAARSSGSNQPVINVRSASLEDIPTLATVLTDSFHPPGGLMYLMHPLFKLGVCEDLRSRLRSNSSKYNCLVAISKDSEVTASKNVIVGTVEISVRSNCNSYSSIGSPYPYIANLAVDRPYRRQGVAKKLLTKCEQIARTWGFSELSLHVLENNERAKKLYLGTGYKLIKIESNFSNWFLNTPRRLLLSKKIQL